jgi:hypothetical protein
MYLDYDGDEFLMNYKFDNLNIVSLGDTSFLDSIIKTIRDFVKGSVSEEITRAEIRKKISDLVSATTPELIEFIFPFIFFLYFCVLPPIS